MPKPFIRNARFSSTSLWNNSAFSPHPIWKQEGLQFCEDQPELRTWGLPALSDSAQDGAWMPQNSEGKGEERMPQSRNPPPPSPPRNTILRDKDHNAACWAVHITGRSAHGREGIPNPNMLLQCI